VSSARKRRAPAG